jgi:tetratricopeptide (TPR) repeat protein
MIGWCRQNQIARGWVRLADAVPAEAERLARDAIEGGTNDPDALWMAGSCLLAFAGEHDIAANAIDRALTLNPYCAHAWMAKGFVSSFRNEPGAAIEAFQRAMRLSPLDPLRYRFSAGLAFAYAVARRYEEALNWADRALQEQQRYTAAMRLRVALSVQLSRFDEARFWLDRLLALQPSLSVREIEAYGVTFCPPDFLVWYAGGLRNAGLPEG